MAWIVYAGQHDRKRTLARSQAMESLLGEWRKSPSGKVVASEYPRL